MGRSTDLDPAEERFLDEAIRLSRVEMERGRGGPFGAVVVRGGEIVGRGSNLVLGTLDPTAHAEVVAIRDACSRLGSYWLEGCDLYASCEPCPMCLGAIYWARIGRLYFAATREDAARAGFDDQRIYDELALPVRERAIPARQLPRDEALASFRRWAELEARRPY